MLCTLKRKGKKSAHSNTDLITSQMQGELNGVSQCLDFVFFFTSAKHITVGIIHITRIHPLQ